MKKLFWSVLITGFVVFGIIPIFTPFYDVTKTAHEKGSTIQIDLNGGRATYVRIVDPGESDVFVVQGYRRWAVDELSEIGVLTSGANGSLLLVFRPEHSDLSGEIKVTGDFTSPIEKTTFLENSLWAKLKRFRGLMFITHHR